MPEKKPRRKNTISQAKNRMRRTIDEILDPSPKDLDKLWCHFESTCCYCDRLLDRERRQGHIDHAVTGAGNHLGNLVLACGACNGDEKREDAWDAFLLRKATSPADYQRRKERILSWFALNPAVAPTAGDDVAKIRRELDHLIDQFAVKCNELKAALGRASSGDGGGYQEGV